MKLAEVAPALIENGYRIVPIQPGTKSPNEANWPRLNADAAQVETWLQQGKADWGVGILGEHTPGVDLDISDEAMLDRVLDWCGTHIGVANKRVGRPPRVLFACQTSQPFAKLRSKKYRSPDGQTHQIEILGRGSQYVAYAVHPDTKRPYAWSGEDPAQLPADLLPSLDVDKARELIAHFESIVPPEWELMSTGTDGAPAEGGGTKGAPLAQVASALKTIPNGDLDYDAWLRIGMALKGAVGDEGRDLFHEWSERSEKYDAAETDWRWDTMKPKTIGAGTLFHLATMNGWERPVAAAAEEFDAVDVGEAATPADLAHEFAHLGPFVWKTPEELPPRPWLYGKHYVRGYLSLTISPGGIGKSSLAISECMAMIAHRNLIGDRAPRPLRVAYWNGEDPQAELNIRVMAAARHFDIPREVIEKSLFVWSGRDLPIKLVAAGRNGLTVARKAIERTVRMLRHFEIDVFIVDPLVRTHSVPENDNTGMDEVANAFREIADRAGCAVDLVHHAAKQARIAGQSEALGAAQSRGAGAILDAARAVRVLARMDEEEARKRGIAAPKRYFRIVSGEKNNMSPPPSTSATRWMMLESFDLGNGAGDYPEGDSVGVVVEWTPPDLFADLEADTLSRVQQRIASGVWRADPQSTDWAGYAVAEVLGIDIGPPKKTDRTGEHENARGRVRLLLDGWVEKGGLQKAMRRDEKNRRLSPAIEVADPYE